jgi:HlyD family secretion protein
MKYSSFRRFIPWMVLALVVTGLVYRLKLRPTPVVAQTLTLGAVRAEVMGTGTLEARVKTIISPRIQGRLAEVLVDQGDAVKAGQVLARLDDEELRQQVAVAQAALDATRATVERVRAEEARPRAVQKQARLAHDRATELMATKVASQTDLDQAVEALGVAEADLARAQAAIVEAGSQVQTADMNLLYRREQLAFTEIQSPYDGLVVRRDRDRGDMVLPGSSLLYLIATNEMWVSAWVDETAMADLTVSQPALVIFRADPGQAYTGEVARIGREADRETREFVVDVRVGKLPPNWAVGQRAEVFIETASTSGVVVLPQKFVLWREGRPGAFVIEGGRARWRSLTLGVRGRDGVEVRQGLSAGDRVLEPRDPKRESLADGRRVKES